MLLGNSNSDSGGIPGCLWLLNSISGAVGFPSLWEFPSISARGATHLNTRDRWKGNGSGKEIDSEKWGESPEL